MPLPNVTTRAPGSSFVSTTKPGTRRECSAPISAMAAIRRRASPSSRFLFESKPFRSTLAAGVGLDPVAVGIDDEGGEIIGPVVFPQTRLAVVAPTCRERRTMEGADAFVAGRRETKMQPRFCVGRNRAL